MIKCTKRYDSITCTYVRIYVWCLESSTPKKYLKYQNKILKVSTLNPHLERFQKSLFWDPIRNSISTEAVNKIEEHLDHQGMKISVWSSTPLSQSYHHELDETPELSSKDRSYFQSLIRIPRWAVELERIDITCKVSMMSYNITMPCEGHLQQVYHIFA